MGSSEKKTLLFGWVFTIELGQLIDKFFCDNFTLNKNSLASKISKFTIIYNYFGHIYS